MRHRTEIPAPTLEEKVKVAAWLLERSLSCEEDSLAEGMVEAAIVVLTGEP
ncbi:MAG: hypothetical protein WCB19_07385 [Thermoplasmata archaeon]